MVSWQANILKTIFRVRRLLNPPTGVLDVQKERQELEALTAKFKSPHAHRFTPVQAGSVPGAWIETPDSRQDNIILYLHGGGYNSGSIHSHRPLAANIAQAAQCRALIIDYRLAPEHPFPAAVQDTREAFDWLVENQADPRQIIIAGDSCGGGLAISLLIHLRDEQQPLPAAVVCLSPWTDLTFSGESWQTNHKKDIMLDALSLKKAAQIYLGTASPDTPLASPLYADLKDLPPILIQVGSDELILSDSTGLADRAKTFGVDVTLEVWGGMQHEWQFAANFIPEGRQAIERIGQFIQDQLRKT